MGVYPKFFLGLKLSTRIRTCNSCTSGSIVVIHEHIEYDIPEVPGKVVLMSWKLRLICMLPCNSYLNNSNYKHLLNIISIKENIRILSILSLIDTILMSVAQKFPLSYRTLVLYVISNGHTEYNGCEY